MGLWEEKCKGPSVELWWGQRLEPQSTREALQERGAVFDCGGGPGAQLGDLDSAFRGGL